LIDVPGVRRWQGKFVRLAFVFTHILNPPFLFGSGRISLKYAILNFWIA
jgi:hypothetical protein